MLHEHLEPGWGWEMEVGKHFNVKHFRHTSPAFENVSYLQQRKKSGKTRAGKMPSRSTALKAPFDGGDMHKERAGLAVGGDV